MTRLTKEIKLRICRNAINQSPVSKELKDVGEKLSKLALDVYNDNVTEEQIETAIRIQDETSLLPFDYSWRGDSRWFYETGRVCASFGGLRMILDFPLNTRRPELKTRPTYTAEHEFTKRFLDLEHKKDSLIKQEGDLKAEIMAILNSCTTLKKLQQVWAESVNFLDGIETDITSANLPAVVIEDLNNKLGISS